MLEEEHRERRHWLSERAYNSIEFAQGARGTRQRKPDRRVGITKNVQRLGDEHRTKKKKETYCSKKANEVLK